MTKEVKIFIGKFIGQALKTTQINKDIAVFTDRRSPDHRFKSLQIFTVIVVEY